ncbi:ABC transporter substrate-binding protein [Cryptobacterium curtum]|uniref:ABC transporter substrate-binding protein n=1 Tax=Cryptobacterium curtum TaxID=84163 RepID=UPI00248DB2F7|nr:ABC transporter substrate-binding protein [Cryptobacterium curtum]
MQDAKTLTRRGFVTLSAAAVSAAFLGGCSSGSGNGSSSESSQEGATKLTSSSGKTMKVICTSESYKRLFDKFTSEVGAPVEFVSMSSGEALSKLKAEGGTPAADLWFGGGVDSFMSAKDSGLLEQVNFAATSRFSADFKDPDNYWFSKGATVVGFIVNNDILGEIGAQAPASWADLTNAAYRNEILMSTPAVSGTNYAAVDALLQNLGDDAGWEYFSQLNENIPFYTKRGSDPSTRVGAGEAAIGITYIDGTLDELISGGNLELVYPSEGLPYMPDGVAAFKNADDVEDAKLFIEWLFSNDENMRFLADIDKKSTILLCIPDVEGIEATFDASQLMKEDVSLFGPQREDVLAKWKDMTSGKDVVSSS